MRVKTSIASGLAAALALMALSLPPAHAHDLGPELAKKLLSEGRIRPLSEILAAVKVEVPGEVLEVELEEEHGGYVYEFKILLADGRVQEVEADAATGKILKVKDDD